MKFVQSVFIVLVFTTSLVTVYGQTEGDLKKYFEGRTVSLRIDMPATKDGVNVYIERNPQVDSKQYKERIDDYGISIEEGGREKVTKIKVKKSHIEVHLGGGGYGVLGDESEPAPYIPEPVSSREKKLEKDLKKETNKEERKEIQRKILVEQESRERTDDENRRQAKAESKNAKDRIARMRLERGSRFNIRFDRKITAQDLTPEKITEILRYYVVF